MHDCAIACAGMAMVPIRPDLVISHMAGYAPFAWRLLLPLYLAIDKWQAIVHRAYVWNGRPKRGGWALRYEFGRPLGGRSGTAAALLRTTDG